MKLFEEINADFIGTERYSLYHLNRADNFLIKNSIKFFLLNTNENNLENSLKQYQMLKSIDINPVLFSPNVEFFLSNNVPSKDIVETSSYSFINNFNEIIKHCNSNYVFFISSNILLDNIDEIVNRFYLTYQNFSHKLAGWTINIIGGINLKIIPEFKIDNNIYYIPFFNKEFFCIKTEYIRKINYLSLIKDNEECHGLEYLIGFMTNQKEEYFIADLNFSLNLLNCEEIDSKKILEKQYRFFEINKNVYKLNENFYNFWNANLFDQH